MIATLTEKRLASLPNVPTIKEQGIDVPLIPQARGMLLPPAAPKAPQSDDQGGSGPLVGGGGPLRGVQPSYADPRVWSGPGPNVGAVTPFQ